MVEANVSRGVSSFFMLSSAIVSEHGSTTVIRVRVRVVAGVSDLFHARARHHAFKPLNAVHHHGNEQAPSHHVARNGS